MTLSNAFEKSIAKTLRQVQSLSQGTHSRILMTGGVRVIFLGQKFWPKVIFFGSMKDAGFFLGRKKREGFFWIAKKELRDFWGYAKKK